MTIRHQQATPDVVQLEIDADKLESLFASGMLCVSDMRCLNEASKAAIWKMCLTSCASRTRCNVEGSGMCRKCMDPIPPAPEPSPNWRWAIS